MWIHMEHRCVPRKEQLHTVTIISIHFVYLFCMGTPFIDESQQVDGQAMIDSRLNSLEIRNFRPVVGHIPLDIALGDPDVPHLAFN